VVRRLRNNGYSSSIGTTGMEVDGNKAFSAKSELPSNGAGEL
jgi:hypothetical protein